jgi:Mn-dependent DtxR family transcriptional regulator
MIIKPTWPFQKELSKQMNIKPFTTTRFIDKLEAMGLVERKAKGGFFTFIQPRRERNSSKRSLHAGKASTTGIQRYWVKKKVQN